MAPNDQNDVYRFFTEVGIIQQLSSTQLENILPDRMSATQFGLLGHLARRPEGETPLQLARAFQVPKTSMTHMVAGLSDRGLIEIAPNPKDARSKIAVATPVGIAFLQEKMAILGQQMAPALSELGPEPFKNALEHLVRIREVLDQARNKNP